MSYINIKNENLISEVIIDRLEALNAMNPDVLSELTDAVQKVILMKILGLLSLLVRVIKHSLQVQILKLCNK